MGVLIHQNFGRPVIPSHYSMLNRYNQLAAVKPVTLPFFSLKKKKRLQSMRASLEAGVSPTLPASLYAKQMERCAAKESLTLAIKDAGVLDALPIGKVTDMERIDINERIIKLERLNPTPRPSTSPFLEGLWRYQWFGTGNSGLLAANLLLESLPSTLASIKNLDLLIMDGSAKSTMTLKFLDMIECNFTLTTKLTVEGPIRLKEEFVDSIVQMPSVPETVVPNQLKSAYEQVLTMLQQLPDALKETISSGLRIPINGALERLFLISYLDEEMLIVRDISGAASVFSKLDGNLSVTVESMTEYES